MVAIVQSNPYACLSRKIGYSVGLEFLLRNVKCLAEQYADKKELTLSDWVSMVKDTFGRREGKKPAWVDIANFFSALNLIRIIGNELHVLYGLEALSIIRRFLGDQESAWEPALRIALLEFVMEADGDVFTNCLASEFERESSRTRIASMVQCKWNAVSGVIINPGAQDRIWDLVSIRTQSVTGSPSGHKETANRNPFARRTEALQSTPRLNVFGSKKERIVEVQDSYLDKVLPTRKGWAKDFCLVTDAGLSEEGRKLLGNLAELGMATASGAFVFWPYRNELSMLRIDYCDIAATEITGWSLLKALVGAYGGETREGMPEMSNEEEDRYFEIIRRAYQLYRQGSAKRGSIRHQIPLYVLKPVLAAICFAQQTPFYDLTGFIDKEVRSAGRRFDLTNIRGTEGGLSLRS